MEDLDDIRGAEEEVEMLTMIKLFLDMCDEENISAESNLLKIKYECEALNQEFHFLTKKFKRNQLQISKLEQENMRLKVDLHLNKISKRSVGVPDQKSSFISPSYIHSSLKFNFSSGKRCLEGADDVTLSPKMKTLYDLVMQYSIKGNYAVAIPLLEQTLVDIENGSSKYCNEYASMLHVLANIYRDIGDYQKSIHLMLEVLIILENTTRASQTKIVNVLNCISVLHGLMYCWSDAAAYCRRSVSLMREIYKSDDVRIARQLESMALIYRSDSHNDQAIECFQEALAIYESEKDVHVNDMIRLKSYLASCYLSQYQFDISLKMYKEIMDSCYQTSLVEIWGIRTSLWKLAEEEECGRIVSKKDEEKDLTKWKYLDVKMLDTLDVAGLRDILQNMAFIYREIHCPKAAKFLETWPGRNIPTPAIASRSFKSRSLMNIHEEVDVNHVISGRCRPNVPRRSLDYLSPGALGLKRDPGSNTKRESSHRTSMSMPRRSKDIDVTIFESWTKSFIIKKSN